MVIIEERNFDRARKKIRENKSKEIVFVSDDDELSRKILDKEKIDILLLKQDGRKDKAKQRNSGLDSVVCRLAKKNNVKIGIFLDEIIKSEGRNKSEILARVRQNVRLCNKNKLKMKLITIDEKETRNEYDKKAIGALLGMPTQMIKDL